MVAQDEKQFDIVVYGATGFAGKLVAAYLAERYANDAVRWAIAGRSEKKLQAIQHELGIDVPLIVADSKDRESLDKMAAATRVVCTTVGPYARYGKELVAACVANHAHYCDLTGEAPFIRQMIDAHHDAARQAGVRIVHSCGFDSIPSDLGTWLLQDRLIELDGNPADTVEYFLLGGNGGFSGGTVASMIDMVEGSQDRAVRQVMAQPYSLNPEGERQGPDKNFQTGIKRDPVTGWWTGPFLMAPINTKIVRRSNALLNYRYGRDFRYNESIRTGKGPAGALKAGALTTGMAFMLGAVAFGPTRKLLQRTVLPAPGQGPSEEVIQNGFFKVAVSGRRGQREVGRVIVRGRGDPGYGATACMLAESALCLALDDLKSDGGILTPASAMGAPLVERLNKQDVQFAFEAQTA